MKVPVYTLLLAAALAVPATALAQNDLSNFSATGRGGVINTFAESYQVIGVNPANLGRAGGPAVGFTIGEFGVGFASRTLSKDLFNHLINDRDQSLTPAQRTELLKSLSGPDVLNLNIDATTFGLSISLPGGLGGLAFSNRLRTAFHLGLNPNAADIIVNGKNAAVVRQYYPAANNGENPNAPLVSTVLDGTSIQLAATSEYSFSYGVNVLDKEGFKASVGVGYRYIQGLGIADIRADGGSLYAFTALSPVFDVNYGALASNPNFNAVKGSGVFNSVGKGNGFDLGLAVEVGKSLRLGASVTDLGNMTWTGNVVTANDQRLQEVQSQGATTYDIFSNIADQFDISNQSLFKYEAAKERKASLPTKFRFGAGLRLHKFFEVGLDVTTPLNKVAGNLTAPFVGLGLDVKPFRWLRLSSGVSAGAGYGTNLPLGLAFVTPVWEMGFSTRDALGYTNNKSPYYSVAMGFLRFKIGGNKEDR